MKKIIMTAIIFAMLLPIVSCSNESSKHNSQFLESMTQYDINGKELSKDTYSYDEKGHLIEENTFSEGYSTKTVYLYNENGQLMKETQTNYFDGKNEMYTFTYEYDKNNNLATKNRFNENNQQIGQISYEYDNKNRLIKVSDTTINQTATYIYRDNNEYSVRTEFILDNDTFYNIIAYELDNNGNILHQIVYAQNSDDEIEQEDYYNYNVNNQITSSKTYFLGILVNKVEYEYSGSLLMKKILYDEVGIYQIEEFDYNENDNIIKQTRKSRSGVVQNYIVFDYSE